MKLEACSLMEASFNANTLPPPMFQITFRAKNSQESEKKVYNGKVISNSRMTPEDYFQDVRHVKIESSIE